MARADERVPIDAILSGRDGRHVFEKEVGETVFAGAVTDRGFVAGGFDGFGGVGEEDRVGVDRL